MRKYPFPEVRVISLETGILKLDGGAMFGVVPKTIWNKIYPSDTENRVPLTMRCLLVDEGKRKLLIDTGIGDKQDQKFFNHYQRSGEETLISSLAKAGISPDTITDVLLTHLHFDHCGGCLAVDSGGKSYPVFKNATYYVSRRHWKWAETPNRLERASFRSENYMPLAAAGCLRLIEKEGFISDSVEVRFFDGHTVGQSVFLIHSADRTLLHPADVIPVYAHIHLPYICAYDIQPLITIKEKEQLLHEAVKHKYTLFSGHDYYTECCTVIKTEKGFMINKRLKLNEWK